MHDRFKFRMYDKEVKSMIYPKGCEEAVEIDGNGDLIGIDTVGLWVGGSNCVLMQSTGLKDKNGKLIYEGDIVDVLCEIDETAIIEWDNEEAKFVINNYTDRFISTFENYYGEDLEVIGNIYKNPEFRKEQ